MDWCNHSVESRFEIRLFILDTAIAAACLIAMVAMAPAIPLTTPLLAGALVGYDCRSKTIDFGLLGRGSRLAGTSK